MILREHLLKRIADELSKKGYFEKWCGFLRDESADMDDEGKLTKPLIRSPKAAPEAALLAQVVPSARSEDSAMFPGQGIVVAAVTPTLTVSKNEEDTAV